MKCNDIIDTALLIMGHSPLHCPPSPSVEAGGPTLRQRLSLLIPTCAASLAAQAFRTIPGLTRSFPDTPLKADLDGTHYIPLPADFLCLDSIRLSDWTVTLREVTPLSDPRLRMQNAQCSGIKASPSRPICAIATLATDEALPQPALLLYGSRLPDPAITVSGYCFRPSVSISGDSEQVLEWPDELLFPLARASAEQASGHMAEL